ncbi:GerMN domain-containing protein [Paenibacillus sp. LHD-117]|uniref:GerMN domain-containing protein n=1 Tax=Paenibacillus sp. LHD-117 TaxID=3071412 RepID=UPI0027DFD45A|nr:GerMN domain-containing protein [Paenibacillus sp. LHD-117]MDQ6418713.1 GerMN domain-containing protein [Paenibacillus sp. LHD-117]
MVQKRWIRHTTLATVLVLPVITAGCGLFSQQTSKTIDPPPSQVEETEGDPTGQVSPDGQADGSSLTVYLQDRNGYLAPISIPVTYGENEQPGQKAMELMVEGGTYAAELPEDFRALIPQGTQILSYEYDKEQRIAKVDFSEPFVSYNAADERDMVEAITWTLTAMSGVEGVELYVEGQLLTEMPEAGYPIDGQLTRSIGINIEAADGVNIANSSPVTLYFSAETLSDEQYYVPVTRLISRSDSPALAAMDELIAGPLNKKELNSVILPDVEVSSIEQKDGVVIVDLEDAAYEPGHQLPAEMLQAVVLSLTETTGDDEVQIRVNGESNLVDSDNKSYSEPVGRPHHVNALKS